MLAGELYDPADEELVGLREKAAALTAAYNRLGREEGERREKILDQLVPNRGAGCYMRGPIYFDYGLFITVGKNFFANWNFTVLDCAPVSIGDDVFIGPNCTLAAAVHPLHPDDRRSWMRADGSSHDYEYGRPIVIEDDCWLGSNVVVCGGVTIGRGSVIGAGSVVVRDIPPHSLAVGNPCRVVRQIGEGDRMKMPKKE